MIILWDKNDKMFCHSYSGEHSIIECRDALISFNNTMKRMGWGRLYVRATNQNGAEVRLYRLPKDKKESKLKRCRPWT